MLFNLSFTKDFPWLIGLVCRMGGGPEFLKIVRNVLSEFHSNAGFGCEEPMSFEMHLSFFVLIMLYVLN
jgi:hypothetical protein